MQTGYLILENILTNIDKKMKEDFEKNSPKLQEEIISLYADIAEFNCAIIKVNGSMAVKFRFPDYVEFVSTKRNGGKLVYNFAMYKNPTVIMALDDFYGILTRHGYTMMINQPLEKIANLNKKGMAFLPVKIMLNKEYAPLKERLYAAEIAQEKKFSRSLTKKSK